MHLYSSKHPHSEVAFRTLFDWHCSYMNVLTIDCYHYQSPYMWVFFEVLELILVHPPILSLSLKYCTKFRSIHVHVYWVYASVYSLIPDKHLLSNYMYYFIVSLSSLELPKVNTWAPNQIITSQKELSSVVRWDWDDGGNLLLINTVSKYGLICRMYIIMSSCVLLPAPVTLGYVTWGNYPKRDCRELFYFAHVCVMFLFWWKSWLQYLPFDLSSCLFSDIARRSLFRTRGLHSNQLLVSSCSFQINCISIIFYCVSSLQDYLSFVLLDSSSFFNL